LELISRARLPNSFATKHLTVLDDAKSRLPPGLVELTYVPGIGPKRARQLYDKLKIHSVADFREAIEAGKSQTFQGRAAGYHHGQLPPTQGYYRGP
jgi:DNA polymerase/3'-5' exonuclease PolX